MRQRKRSWRLAAVVCCVLLLSACGGGGGGGSGSTQDGASECVWGQSDWNSCDWAA